MKTIEKDWDQGGYLQSDADPEEEFQLWKDFAETHPEWWKGNEFTLKDFEEYISQAIDYGCCDD